MTQPIKPYPGHKTYATAIITTEADGLSDVIDLGGLQLNSVQMSTAGWTNAGLTFRGSAKSSDEMQSIYHTTAAIELNYASSASYAVSVDPKLFAGYRFIQLRSGVDGTAVAQAAARSVILGMDRIDK